MHLIELQSYSGQVRVSTLVPVSKPVFQIVVLPSIWLSHGEEVGVKVEDTLGSDTSRCRLCTLYSRQHSEHSGLRGLLSGWLVWTVDLKSSGFEYPMRVVYLVDDFMIGDMDVKEEVRPRVLCELNAISCPISSSQMSRDQKSGHTARKLAQHTAYSSESRVDVMSASIRLVHYRSLVSPVLWYIQSKYQLRLRQFHLIPFHLNVLLYIHEKTYPNTNRVWVRYRSLYPPLILRKSHTPYNVAIRKI
ncbi:hypothetical protein BJ878DRAFT_3669 [Calycina marina]|uniref:Uncharacterized protein n=1 Tax=Calycina marina TaxID=1763456 RepID=A0A9P8CJ64_9HELO|nr:hypothetical protein BJ878DRAFT_3669 [Calycina marina]